MAIRLEAPQHDPRGPDGQGWNRLSLNAHMGSQGPQCALRPRSYPLLWESQDSRRARWGGYGACIRPDETRDPCGGCPVLAKRTELRSFTPAVLARIERRSVGEGFQAQAADRVWLMNRPDNGWAEHGVIWSWDDLARLQGWRVDSRRYRDEHGDGFWLHATHRLLTGATTIYGVGDPIPSPERTRST